jgi:ferric-dicitrate binding protein FerR (iron transport regulator)
MKKLFLVSLIVFASIVHAAADPAGTIENVSGTTSVLAAGTTTWKAAPPGTKLFANDRLRTDSASSAEIRWSNGGTLRLAEKSSLTVKEPAGKAVPPDVKLLNGKVWATMKKLAGTGKNFSVESPTAVAGIRGTVFRLDVGADSATDVLVYEGKVAVGPSGSPKGDTAKSDTTARREIQGPSEIEGPTEVTLTEWVTIVAGQQIRVERTGAFRKWQFDRKQDSLDAWVKYNLDRDAKMEKK